MSVLDAPGLVAGAVALGLLHGAEPGHGWPVAASYALDQANKWVYGFAASFILGVGHLVSSIAMVLVFFWAKSVFSLTQVNEPIAVAPGVEVGGPVSLVAGVLLILLGVREYRHGHSHSHREDGHDHSHSYGDAHDHAHDAGDGVSKFDHFGGDHEHSHDHGGHDHGHGHSHDHSHDHGDGGGLLARVKTALLFVGGHSHGSLDDAADRGLWGIAGFAFLLGFAHEEEFEIIAICAGSQYCLELMLVYATTVVVGIVGLTLLLIAGYERSEERVRAYADQLPAFSAAVLILMGVGFVAGLF
jgi:hypothetical protein